MNTREEYAEQVDAAAARWLVRQLDGPLKPEEQQAFDRWLAADPRHPAAFDEAREALSIMDALRDGPAAVDAAASRRRHGRPARRRFAVLATRSLAAAGLLLAVALTWLAQPWIGWAADYRTGPGELRSIELADGSRLELGPSSAVKVRFGDHRRRLELLEGVALFDVASDAEGRSRPFQVVAGGGTVEALGTAFVVDRLPGTVDVAVVEHAVAIRLDADPGGADTRLDHGRALRYSATAIGEAHEVDIERILAWQQQRLVFDRLPLDEVIARLDRHHRGRIVLANPALATHTVSGIFDARNTAAALEALQRELGIRVVHTPLVTVLY